MEYIKKEDLEILTSCAGEEVNDLDFSKLKKIYAKLKHICILLQEKGFKYEIRQDPRKQAGPGKFVFHDYHWAKIYPSEYYNDARDKFAYIVGFSNTVHFHMMGIKNFQNLPESLNASAKSSRELDFQNKDYEFIIDEFIIFDKQYRKLFVETCAKLNIPYFMKIKKKMKTKKLIELLTYKKQIILQGPPGTGKTREAKLIAKEILGLASTDNLKNNEQFKIIQFHPSYTYEDFVRGIVATTNDEFLEYKTVNKILGDFARKANQTNLTGEVDDFERAWGQLVEDINENKVKKIGTSNVTIEINSQGNIKFASPVATFEKTYELYKFGKTDLKYETYQKIVLKYLKDTNGKYQLKDYVAPTETQSDKPYVLIIDEINRANLSSVLGELIYALEYRGQTVESIYSTLEDGHSLVLPNNLYIIGTMNTADRSVGHIDYAIRRRFAFVDVLPQKLQDDNEIYFNTNDFNKVSLLFNETNVSKEFEIDAVQIGHSYFIVKKKDVMNDEKRDELFKMKMKYEVKPILLEYVRDGILIGEYEGKKIKEYIKSL